MQFEAVALISQDTADIESAVTRLMEPYNLAHEVAPYKEYVNAEGITRLANAFHLASVDPPALVAWFVTRGEEAGVDDNGLYIMTTSNPRGYWDGWTLRSLKDDVGPVQALPADIVAHAVIMPDGQWRDFEPLWGWSEAQVAATQGEAHDLIMSFPDCIAVVLEYHR